MLMNRIGRNPRIGYNTSSATFTPEETNVAKTFEKEWFVTFARTNNFKDKRYSFFFAYPGADISARYGIDDKEETLVLMDGSHVFDERILDFVDKTISEYRNRLDTRRFFLISNDKFIKKKTTELRISKPETRLVFPYTFPEFSNTQNSDAIWEKLKESFYGRDLFAYEKALETDVFFFGRQGEVEELYNKYISGQNSGVFGLRRIGKTSVLFALLRKLKLEDNFGFFINCENTALNQKRWYEALEFLIRGMARTLQSEKGINPSIHIRSYTEKDAYNFFQSDLKKIHESIGRKRILLIFDEIEKITFDTSIIPHWKDGRDFILFWQTLRALNQAHSNLFSYIIAGTNPRIIETPMINGLADNPIYRAVTPTYLSFFNFQQVKEMVARIGNLMGLEFDEEIYTYLTNEFGGHPFLVRQVCSLIHKSKTGERPVKVTKFFYESNRESFGSSLADYVGLIVEVLKTFYPNEYKLLGLLAVNNYDEFVESAKTSQMLIQHLQGYNLIIKDNEKYHLTIGIIASYLSEVFKSERKLNQAEQQWAYITEERGKLETKLRKIIKFSLLFKTTKAKGLEKFLQIIPSERRVKVQAYNFEEILSGVAEIYFLDLKTYMVSNWADFQQIFEDKVKFESNCEIVNQYRVDAHAKLALSDEEFERVKNSLNWLNTRASSF